QIDLVVKRFMRNHSKQYLYEEGQRRRVSIGTVSTPADLSMNPQLAAREWFARIDDKGRGLELRYPGQPWCLGASPASIRRPAPLLGEHDAEIERELAAVPAPATGAPRATESNGDGEPKRPLEGLKVLDFSWFGAGPIATRALAVAGADVIRVETAKRPDGLRASGPRPPGSEGYNVSGYFNNFNNEKRSITIDLTTVRGHELGLKLVRWADVFLTNMTNRAIEQVGLTPDAVIEANPNIVALYQSMQGLDGPHQGFLGFGAVLCAIAGANYTMGFEHQAPSGPGSYSDFVVNPMHATVALLAAVRHRRRTGEGQLIDMSQLESSVAAMALPLFAYDNGRSEHRREGNRVPWAAPHGAFRVRGEDRWVALACDTETRWRALAGACGHAEWAEDPRFATLADRKSHEDALETLVSEWASTQDEEQAVHSLQAVDVPAMVVQEALDVLSDDHLAARGYFAYPEHAEAGPRAHDGSAWRLSRTPVELRGPSPLLGEHTYEVCNEVLGLSSDEIAELLLEDVLA
ncbi:MAG: CoA transferase, partial [Dehalococcoidia bacterium]|nr:CoA transferase [Dehalococcoidia bacterium]